MEKWEILIGSTIGSTIFLVIGIYLDLTVFGPLIDSAFESGLINEVTINGVTAPTKEIFDPIVLSVYLMIPKIIEIIGLFGIISSVVQLVKNFL